MNVSITPIFPMKERSPEERRESAHKPIDSKVRGLVLERIADAKGALLSSSAAPQFLLPGFETGKIKTTKKKKQNVRKRPLPRKVPIGLMAVDEEGWLNALMQFILYVPGFAESFTVAPKSFSGVLEFIDQYHQDLSENKSISSGDGHSIFAFFAIKFPHFSLEQIFHALIELLKPKWVLFRRPIEEEKNISAADLFLSIGPLKKQIFAEPNQFFDLDAFIEKRPDEGRFHYITYVKIDGCWYQCDDDRITQLRSDMLSLPLQRGVLAHYKKVF